MTTLTQSQSASQRASSNAAAGNREKYLTFQLGREEYGFPILVVREIIGLIDVTPLPQTPSYVKGVINLRGKIIPVIELRSKFGLPEVEYTPQTCIVVVEIASTDGQGGLQLGVIVDAVSEVLDIDREHVEAPPSFGSSIPLSFIDGVGKIKDKVIILLSINSVGATDDLERVRSAGQGVPEAGAGHDHRALAA